MSMKSVCRRGALHRSRRCYSAAPKLLSDDEEGFVTLRGSSMEIADEQVADAEEAVAACPERAITLTRSS